MATEPWVLAAGFVDKEDMASMVDIIGPASFFLEEETGRFEGAPFEDALADFREAYDRLVEALLDAGLPVSR